MDAVGSARRIICAMALAALLPLLLARGAEAKFPPETGAAEPPPGITITGIGFAPKTADAVAAAVRDSRSRAEAIARALGLGLGAAEEVELPRLTQFGSQEAPAAAAATVTFPIVGGGTGEDAARSVVATGTASARVRPRNRDRSRSIKAAALQARRVATPKAAATASHSAVTAAAAAGFTLGTIVSVSQVAPLYYGPGFYDAALGSFGPGQFCGIVRRPIFRRDPETGLSKVVRRVRQRRCFFQTRYDVELEIRYEAS